MSSKRHAFVDNGIIILFWQWKHHYYKINIENSHCFYDITTKWNGTVNCVLGHKLISPINNEWAKLLTLFFMDSFPFPHWVINFKTFSLLFLNSYNRVKYTSFLIYKSCWLHLQRVLFAKHITKYLSMSLKAISAFWARLDFSLSCADSSSETISSLLVLKMTDDERED